MGIFSRIASAIFGSPAKADEAPANPAAAGGAPAGATVAQAGGAAAGAATAAAPMTLDQVQALIAKIADSSGHSNYNWKQSIVDLMKLLNLDSSLASRKELAEELGYKGALDGSAEMNLWLHKQVMEKLAASGGVVPDSLK
ncbi:MULTISPECIES: DUF3597 domain-containing protein [unclassified Beijerinckia]|uniref:DUF3597 domain-containing protein n=1 Tax=unclassified Beijerinckia TaxID=2638183 RepID=UPI00089B2F11|nr:MULTISPECIES: DUF3597 domain-containing protein [unclassified Beijerinckia]MDH7794069.1 3-oxoacyl-ACP reductase-like protein [Beijerinckia sp. GAS462]SEB52604.1 protein of unknown function [Beijerinckia sp. 28-YEA-48]